MFPTDWGFKCSLVIQSSQVNSGLTNFPILITEDTLPASIFSNALNGGGDIRFSSDADGATQLACEVVNFDTLASKAEIYVKVPSISSSVDTTIYIWYGKTGETQPAVTDAYGRNNVWDSNYKAVYHFKGNSNDSTSGGFNGTDSNVSYADSYASFNGSNSKIDTGNIGISGASARSYLIRAYVDSTSSAQADIVGHGTESAHTSDHIYVYLPWGAPWDSGAGFYNGHYSNDWYTASNQYSYNTFTNLVTSYNGGAPSSTAKMFLNGVSKTVSGAGATTLNTADSYYGIGYQRKTNNNYFKGRIDELRVSNTQRSNDWNAVESISLNSPATLIVEGTPVEIGGGTDITVTPTTLSIVSSAINPVVEAIKNSNIEATTESAIIYIIDFSIEAVRNAEATPEILVLNLSTIIPQISTGQQATVEPVTVVATLSATAPTVEATKNTAFTVSTVLINFSAPTATATAVRNTEVDVYPLTISTGIITPTIITYADAEFIADTISAIFTLPAYSVSIVYPINRIYTLAQDTREFTLAQDKRKFTLKLDK